MTHHRMVPVSALVLSTVLSCSPRPDSRDTAADVEAVTAAGERERAGVVSGNVDSAVVAYAPDAVIMPPNEPMVRGHEGLRTWLQGMYQQFNISITYPASDVTVADDWAIQRYTLTATLTPKAGGAAIQERGKGIHVYRRQPDGSWLIVQDIWNTDAPSPPPSPAPRR